MAFEEIAIQFGVAAGRWLISKWLGGGAKPKLPDPGSIEIPTTQEGSALSLVYGTRRIAGNVVVVGRNSHAPRLFDSTVVGYRYRVAFQMVFGVSNATPTYGAQASLVSLFVGDRKVTLEFNPDPDTQYILENDFYGGDDRGGALRGRIIFQGGSWEQVAPAAWITSITNALPGEPPSLNPAHISGLRGQIVASFIGYEDERGMEIGESARLEPFAAECYVPVSIPGYIPGTASIGTGDSNPASVLYNLLVERGGVPADALDIDSFTAAASVFEQEEHGVSIEWKGGKVSDHVKEVENQTDVTICKNPDTGLYELVMIRQNYDPDDPGECPVFTASDVVGQPKFSATTWAEAFSEVRVKYMDRSMGYTERSAVEQNGALIDTQLGRRRTKEISYPGVSNFGLASKLAARELNSIGRPMVRVRVTFTRRAHRLRRGSVFRLQWPDGDLDMVFRCVRVGRGTLERGMITVDALQDRFDDTRPSFTPPDTVGPVQASPLPLVHWIATEAPRWVLAKAFDAGLISNIDAQRGYYLAAPEGDDVLWRARSTIGTAAATIDKGPVAFPGYFTVDADYPRTAGPYDTTTGIQIRAVGLVTLANATPTQISTLGRNLIQIGGELLAFESFTSLGGNLYQLEDVWRGVLDTVPADHVEGEVGYFLPGAAGTSAIGAGVFAHGDAVHVVGEAATSTWTPTDASPSVDLTARSRTRLPYPGTNLLVNGSQTPAQLVEEGVTLDWRDRLRTAAAIVRQDAADETLPAGQTFDAVAYKGLGPQEGGDQVVLAANHSSHTAQVALGAAGHGVLEVGVDARLAVDLPDGSTPTLGGWQVPTLQIDAPHWRGLLLNPFFDEAATVGWTWTSGTPTVGSTNGLGGGGNYVKASSAATLDGYQTRSVAGYPPADLRAILRFAAIKNPAGTGSDTVTVYLYSLDAAGVVLDTQTYGPASPATWTWQTLEIARLDPATTSIKVRMVFTAAGGGGATPLPAVTALRLRVGQISDQLLLNPSFESTPATASWTATVGSWQALTASPYGSPTYLRPNDGASAQLDQVVTPPDGYESNAAAVLECGRMNDAASDTGKVTLAALDGGGSVITSVTTGDEAIAGTAVWARRQLVLPLPVGTATVRARLDATRVSGTPLNACFDDCDLRIHRDLDPVEEFEATFDAGATQRLPATVPQWAAAFPTILAPNHGLYDGTLVGRLGTEPMLEVVTGDDARAGATFVADMGLPSGVQTTTAYEMASRGAESIRVAPIGSSFANFASSQAWAALVFFKVGEATWAGAADLLSRTVGGIGWSVGIDGSGAPTLTIAGEDATDDVTGSATCTWGDLQALAAVYDPGTQTATLIDALGSYDLDCSTLGEFRTDDVGRMQVWGGGAAGDVFAGQVARVCLWRTAAPSVADLQAVITYATTPAGLAISDYSSRTGAIRVVIGEDADGALLDTFGPGRVAIGAHLGFAQRGLVTMPAIANLAPADFTTGDWTASGGTVESPTSPPTPGPDRQGTAARIVGTNAQGYQLGSLALGSAGTIHVQGFARASAAHNARVTLKNNSGSTVDTADYAVGTTWQPFTLALAWDGSTSGVGRLLFSGSDTGSAQTIYLAPAMLVSTQPAWPGHIPVGSPGATAPVLDVSALTEHVNREGELAVDLAAVVTNDCVLARLHNGADDHDLRELRFEGGADVTGVHADGAGGTASATISSTAIDPGERWTAKLRWARAGLRDGVTGEWSSVRTEQGGVETSSGRSATWTASTAPVVALDVGHGGGSEVTPGLVFGVSVKSREPRL